MKRGSIVPSWMRDASSCIDAICERIAEQDYDPDDITVRAVLSSSLPHGAEVEVRDEGDLYVRVRYRGASWSRVITKPRRTAAVHRASPRYGM